MCPQQAYFRKPTPPERLPERPMLGVEHATGRLTTARSAAPVPGPQFFRNGACGGPVVRGPGSGMARDSGALFAALRKTARRRKAELDQRETWNV